MEKLGIIIDANLITVGIASNKERRGIYFVTVNLINELIRRDNVNLFFFINKREDVRLKKFIRKEWSSYNIIFYEYHPLSLFRLSEKLKNNNLLSKILKKYFEYQKKKQVVYRENFLNKHRCDIFLSPCNKIPGIFLGSNLKKFTCVYDMLPIVRPEFFNECQIKEFKNMINSFNDKDFYFTISEYTRADLLKVKPKINPSHVFCSYISCSEDSIIKKSCSDSIRKKYKIPSEKKYVFSLFAIEKRKNLERCVRAFLSFISKNNLDDIVYVVGGGKYETLPSFFDEVDSSKIVFTGYIEDSDLAYLYSDAEWFVFTSMYEGFGLPVLEALRCGCPVITSNTSSLPEVVGDAGIIIDPESVEQHIEAYEKFYFDHKFRDDAIGKGFIQAQKFSWKKTVDFMIEKMQENI